jgi:hypothetical protein
LLRPGEEGDPVTHQGRVYERRVWLIEQAASIGDVTDLSPRPVSRKGHGCESRKLRAEITNLGVDARSAEV